MPPLFRTLVAAACLAFALAPVQAADPTTFSIPIEQTVVKMPIVEGVSMDDAVDSMKLRANFVNMMFVAHQPLYEQLRAMGMESGRLEIFQFCDPQIAGKMVAFNSIFAAYMPCRIALVEEPDGQAYLMMLNLDILIQGAELSPELKALAVEVNDKLMEIMTAGANGDL
jgi:uncharacterized protein (DUF302 family)